MNAFVLLRIPNVRPALAVVAMLLIAPLSWVAAGEPSQPEGAASEPAQATSAEKSSELIGGYGDYVFGLCIAEHPELFEEWEGPLTYPDSTPGYVEWRRKGGTFKAGWLKATIDHLSVSSIDGMIQGVYLTLILPEDTDPLGRYVQMEDFCKVVLKRYDIKPYEYSLVLEPIDMCTLELRDKRGSELSVSSIGRWVMISYQSNMLLKATATDDEEKL